ncbi:HYC_CC_PP family protein [Empedobacter falsenii]|uniref:HYC_CC_PP family protein n=1 Tax=Empedobacter falsenii TaxID=343874 RepID=UPI0025769C79|nr:hypothetical protein [Empedobacter falsenii]MDM1318779.1 hypothetical protein [Empedobacter falsenii]
MQQYIKYVLSVVLIFSNLSYAFSMHFCQGVVEQVTINHLDNNSCEMEVSTSCCPPKEDPTHCEIPEGENKKKDDCCKDISYSDKFVEKQTVKIQKLVPISFIASVILQIRIPIQDEEVSNQSNFLDFYVASNAPPNYILNSQLTFYEG